MRIAVLLMLFATAGFAVMDDMGNVGAPGVVTGEPGLRLMFIGMDWEEKAPMITGRISFALAGTGGLMYAIGGLGMRTESINEVYDPVADSWSVKAPMPTARIGCVGAAVNGKVYVVGGFVGGRWLNVVEEYDPLTDSWQSCPAMEHLRTTPAVVELDGKLYVIGGFSGGVLFPKTVERYDPATNSWDTVAPLPAGRTGLAATVFDGKIYAMGGWTGIPPAHSDLFVYDPAVNSWSTLEPMPTGRLYLGVAPVGEYIAAIGGQLELFGEQVGIVELYDPANDRWLSSDALSSPRGSAGVAAFGGGVFVIGGRTDDTVVNRNKWGQLASAVTEERRAELQPLPSALPNPLRSATTVTLPPGTSGELRIFDASGRCVRVLSADGQSVSWDRTDASGVSVQPGIYFGIVRADGRDLSVKLVVSD